MVFSTIVDRTAWLFQSHLLDPADDVCHYACSHHPECIAIAIIGRPQSLCVGLSRFGVGSVSILDIVGTLPLPRHISHATLRKYPPLCAVKKPSPTHQGLRLY